MTREELRDPAVEPGTRSGAAGTAGAAGLGLEVTELSKAFNGTPVLDAISLRVPPGKIVSLIGPSGSGKSTLLSILTGALAPDSGSIRYDGCAVDSANRPFAFMPQRDLLLPWRRAVDNAGIGLEVTGRSRRDARRCAGALFEVFGLTGAERRYPRQLSGGMRQRVSFVRTVVQDKPVLLLDEPFGALDALTRDEMQTWLLEIWATHRWSILLVTHDIREAIRLSDHVHVLSASPGRLVGDVDIPHDLTRGDRFSRDRRVGALEAQLRGLLTRQPASGQHQPLGIDDAHRDPG